MDFVFLSSLFFCPNNAGRDCIEIQVWYRGMIGGNKLMQNLHSAVRLALADFIMEHFILHHPLASVPAHIKRLARESPEPHRSLEADLEPAMDERASANSSMVVIDSTEATETSDEIQGQDPEPLSLSKSQLELLADSQREDHDDFKEQPVRVTNDSPRKEAASPSADVHDQTPSMASSSFTRSHTRTPSTGGTQSHSRTSSIGSRFGSLSLAEWHEKAHQGQCGRLHAAYCRDALDLISAGCKLSSTSFFKMDFILAARSVPTSTLQDLMQLVNECGAGVTSCMFRLVRSVRYCFTCSLGVEMAWHAMVCGVGDANHYQYLFLICHVKQGALLAEVTRYS